MTSIINWEFEGIVKNGKEMIFSLLLGVGLVVEIAEEVNISHGLGGHKCFLTGY
jgi:hypothetical protein